ncbi:hypothetical protein TorRG33x02_230400, partial [Trema orientale]
YQLKLYINKICSAHYQAFYKNISILICISNCCFHLVSELRSCIIIQQWHPSTVKSQIFKGQTGHFVNFRS